MRRFTLTLVTVLVVLIAPVASAGGAWIEFSESSVQPGDHLIGSTAVNWSIDVTRWEHLGPPSEGPYFAWLHPVDEIGAPVSIEGWPEDGWVVGVAEPSEGPIWPDGLSIGPDHVVLAIEVPAVPPGRYAVTIQNGSKTTALGDLLGSFPFIVAAGSGGRQPADVQADVYQTVEKRIASYTASLEAGYAVEAPFLLTEGPGLSMIAPPEARSEPKPVVQVPAPEHVEVDPEIVAALGTDAPTAGSQPQPPDRPTLLDAGDPLGWSTLWVSGAVVLAAAVLARRRRRLEETAVEDRPGVLVGR